MSDSRRYDAIEVTGNDQTYLKVLKHIDDRARSSLAAATAGNAAADRAIASSTSLLESLGYRPSDAASSQKEVPVEQKELKLRPWEEIVKEAEGEIPGEVSVSELLSAEDMARSNAVIDGIRARYDMEHRLDALDWGIAGIAGAVSALVDIFLVQVPSTPGRLGAAGTKGGWLSDTIREKLKKLYTPEQVRKLEKKFKVPYDASTSKRLAKKVAGLGPRSHRFQSLGHDPILGFIFGVRDILQGRFTAIDKFGKIISQDIPGAETGLSLFQAIALQLGHLKSDIGTPAGLPAPFMPLFQLLQFGDIDGRTVGELSRAMYANGYDFGHFLAMSVPVMIIEVLVRLLYFAKRLAEKHTFMESIPFDLPRRRRQPKLQTMLFTAHTIATAANAGKVWFTKNPMAINLPQWQWYAKVSYSQLRWVLFTKEAERLDLVQKSIDSDWQHINDELLKSWSFAQDA